MSLLTVPGGAGVSLQSFPEPVPLELLAEPAEPALLAFGGIMLGVVADTAGEAGGAPGGATGSTLTVVLMAVVLIAVASSRIPSPSSSRGTFGTFSTGTSCVSMSARYSAKDLAECDAAPVRVGGC